jgi:glycopeptide antibiotics resistance protein
MIPFRAFIILIVLPVIASIILYLLFSKEKQKHFKGMPKSNLLLYVLIIIHILSVINFTIFPIPYQKQLIQDLNEFPIAQINYIPFKQIIQDVETIVEYDINAVMIHLFGNLVMLIPLGFYIPIIWRKINNLLRATLFVLLCSLAIEGLQLLISLIIGVVVYRSVDIDDVILNTMGGILGFGLLKASLPLLNNLFSGIGLGKSKKL